MLVQTRDEIFSQHPRQINQAITEPAIIIPTITFVFSRKKGLMGGDFSMLISYSLI